MNQRSGTVRQLGILFLHLGEYVFIPDDDDTVERVWADENTAVAELEKEGWKITSEPALIEPDLPGNEERNIAGFSLERSIQ